MKKKILAIFLSACIIAGIFDTMPVHAEGETTLPGATIETAQEINFDTNYSVTWGDGMKQCFNKLTLPEDGIITLTSVKPVSTTYKTRPIELNLYNDEKKLVWCCRDESSSNDTASIHVGLAAGTYTFGIASQLADKLTSVYTFSFQPSNTCEIEIDNSKTEATPMAIDKTYTGYFGSSFTSLSPARDDLDIYKVSLTKRRCYILNGSNLKKETTITKILGQSSALDNIWPSTDAKGFCVSPEKEFVAPYTGSYYICIRNYGGEQFQYTLAVTDITPQKTKITSVKSTHKKLSVNWKKQKCHGYQIQYSTNKNFKHAKTLTNSGQKNNHAVIKNLPAKKSYYIRVRSYKEYDKKRSYSYWSNVKKVKTK